MRVSYVTPITVGFEVKNMTIVTMVSEQSLNGMK